MAAVDLAAGQVSFLLIGRSQSCSIQSAHIAVSRAPWFCRWAVRNAYLVEGAHVQREHRECRSLMQAIGNTRKVGLQSIHRIGTQENILCRTCPRRPADRAAVQRSSRRRHMQQVRPACVHHNDGALLQAHLLHCSLQRTLLRHRFLCRAMAAPTSAFDIPAAPILIPKGPWKEVDGCVCAPKGFKAQGEHSSGGRPAHHVQGDWFPPTTRCLSPEGP